MLVAAGGLRQAWVHAAAEGVDGHRRREASRGLMRVIVRAWREATDDVRAGAAKWMTRWADATDMAASLSEVRPCACGYVSQNRALQWQHVCACRSDAPGGAMRVAPLSERRDAVELVHFALARRLVLPEESVLYTELGWRMRVVLLWQRPVRAGKVGTARRGSPAWLAAERQRVHSLAERYRSQVTVDGDWQCSGKRARGQGYAWRTQDETASQLHVTSGAAAVISRRQVAATPGDKRARSPSPPRPPPAAASPACVVRASPRSDVALFLPPPVMYRASRCARLGPRVPRPPFGDG
jgi:hypothetical protein